MDNHPSKPSFCGIDGPLPACSATFRYRWTGVRLYPRDSYIDGRTVHLIHLSLSNSMLALDALKLTSIYVQPRNMSTQDGCSRFGKTRSWCSAVPDLYSCSMLHETQVGKDADYTFDLDDSVRSCTSVPKDCTVTIRGIVR